ncbi:MAG: hypothetical protein H7Z38_23740 [Rubrivivax sp.]|nr:hypothetical protein [Pyrinomonadaceae bacterium]
MKDHNDFFDEMIDVDDDVDEGVDPEVAEFLEATEDFDDDEEYEEEDATVVRTAVLLKNDMLALLSLKAGEAGGQIVRFDPREQMPSLQRYESETEALKWYARSLATSRKNGWSVVYDGEPMIG